MTFRSGLLRSTTFRFTLLYLCLLSAGALVLFGTVYWATTAAVSRQIESTIDAEIRGLAENYQRAGQRGLVEAVRLRAGQDASGPGLYLLVGPRLQRLAGNLSRWPQAEPDPQGWITFRIRGDGQPGGGFGRARLFRIDGLHLLVGHDIREQTYVAGLIRESLAWALAVVVVMTTIAGYLLSRRLIARIEGVTAASQEIMAGDLDRRIALSGGNDEFDDLARSLNAMLDQIQRLLNGLRQVTDNIAHDLRSPLARLRSRLEVALLAEQDPAAYRQVLAETIGEADRLLATFNALLTIAEAEAGAAKERFAPVDPAALLADVADFYEPLAEEASLALRCIKPNSAGGTGLILGDRDLLFQALANLLENAINHAAAGKTLDLSLTATDRDLVFAVADRGPGINDADRERVTGRFVRLEESRSTPGSGLGLALAAAVARLHGGRLTLADNQPGLLVEMTLPNAGTNGSLREA